MKTFLVRLIFLFQQAAERWKVYSIEKNHQY